MAPKTPGGLLAMVLEEDAGPLKFFLRGHFVLGLAMLALGVYQLVNDAVLVQYAYLVLSVLDAGYEMVWTAALAWPFLSGILTLVFATIAIRGVNSSSGKGRASSIESLDRHLNSESCERCCGSPSRGLFRVAVVVLSIVFILQVALAGGYMLFLHAMAKAVNTTFGKGGDQNELETDLVALQMASFNLCCAAEGWSAHGEVGTCSDDGVPPVQCELPDDMERHAGVLCTCYSSSRYDELYERLAEDNKVCAVLGGAVVRVGENDRVPGTNIPVSAFVPVSEVRIVGFNGPPEEDKVTAKAPLGYGCGFGGYAKAFQWAQYKYVSAKLRNVAFVLMCISGVELLLLLFVICMLRSENDEEYFNKMQDDLVQQRREQRTARAEGRAGGAVSKLATVVRGMSPNMAKFSPKRSRRPPPEPAKFELDP